MLSGTICELKYNICLQNLSGWKHNIAEYRNNRVKDVNLLQNQLQNNYRTLHHLFDELPRVASSHLLLIRSMMCTNISTAVIIMYCMTVAPLMQIGVTSPVSVCGFPRIPFSALTDIHTKLHKQPGDMWCKHTVISRKGKLFILCWFMVFFSINCSLSTCWRSFEYV